MERVDSSDVVADVSTHNAMSYARRVPGHPYHGLKGPGMPSLCKYIAKF